MDALRIQLCSTWRHQSGHGRLLLVQRSTRLRASSNVTTWSWMREAKDAEELRSIGKEAAARRGDA